MVKRGKRGIEIQILIILILAVLALILVAVAFTGGFSELWKRIRGTQKAVSGMEISEAREFCLTYYHLGQKAQFCNMDIEIAGIGNTTCNKARGQLGITEVPSDFCD
ncbi:MAG: hypothetical protein QXE64_02610 [Candidatus Pacearchaeota archaeon]